MANKSSTQSATTTFQTALPTSIPANVISATKTSAPVAAADPEKLNASDVCSSVADWSVMDVVLWARTGEHFSKEILYCLRNEEIDGKVLLALCENDIRDMRYSLNYQLSFGDLKKLWLAIRGLQERHFNPKVTAQSSYNGISTNCLSNGSCPLGCSPLLSQNIETTPVHRRQQTETSTCCSHIDNREAHTCGCMLLTSDYLPNVPVGGDSDAMTPPLSIDGRAVHIPPEFFKTFMSLGYSFLVTWITSFVMVIVHERVPDMKRYPPLPDIFLDNVPHIPWAFHMCEITGTLLFAIWSCVCIFHKYRMVLLRRFFALAGTVFLLRCVTMLITSLSVPGTHLQCDQSDYAVDDTDLTLTEALELRISRAYTIWSGLGMSIQGVRTCGDYMFSGHTVALTLLNFFITEYTPRNLYFLHTLTWLLNMFGIFFILAAHEHYSIDVFVAFYITSRLFLYYHTLANNQALMSRDSTRTRIWFPMFSYFENSVYGIIPNEFDTVSSLLDGLLRCLMDFKDIFMMTAQRFAVDPPQLAIATKNLLLSNSKQHRHVSTSTHSAATTGFPSSTLATTTTTTLSTETLADNDEATSTTTTTTTATRSLLVQYETENCNNDSAANAENNNASTSAINLSKSNSMIAMQQETKNQTSKVSNTNNDKKYI